MFCESGLAFAHSPSNRFAVEQASFAQARVDTTRMLTPSLRHFGVRGEAVGD
jgi:hypothetical protein